MKRQLLALALLVTTLATAYARQQPMGAWRTHISYSETNQIAQSDNILYAISSGALYSVHKNYYSTEVYSRLTGLNDNNISKISYSQNARLLLIAYSNSNIDLMYDDGRVQNINDIYRKNMFADKSINHIFFHNHYAYLAMGFGLTQIDLEAGEVTGTYFISEDGGNEKYLHVEINGGTIYALSEKHIRLADINNTNLLNYHNWSTLPTPDPGSKNTTLAIYDNSIYLVKENNRLYRHDGSSWTLLSDNVRKVKTDNDVLFVQDTLGHISAQGEVALADILAQPLTDAVFDKQSKTIWVSTLRTIMSVNPRNGESNMAMIEGPMSNTAWNMGYFNGRMYIVPGGRFATEYRTPGNISIFDGTHWEVIEQWYLSLHSAAGFCNDLVSSAVDPSDPAHLWVAAYGNGLFEFRNGELIANYNASNSPLECAVSGTTNPVTIANYTRVEALNYDKHGNLWMTNSNGKHPIKYIDPQGRYHGFSYSQLNSETMQTIHFDTEVENLKYILCVRFPSSNTSGLVVIDDNGTIDRNDDDRHIAITELRDQNENLLRLSEYRLQCMVQDHLGTIWLGTTKGIIQLPNTKNIFDRNYRASRIIIPRNDGTNLADYLLHTEEITDIKVDGADRKWIATRQSGVFLVSPDGLTTIHHFNTDNSPILSNNVTSIGIMENTGEVFFGTENGIISYQSDAIGAKEQFTDVHAYPNPVRPEYDGLITITGLTDGASVRITDIGGNMVYETISLGSVATWNGCRLSGDRVATGVYFAHCVSADRKEKAIAKILIIH